ncbi:MAG: eukaryotic-like serine/threonine-protein kinase [Actinomycetota bacterium]|jgi:serine/threonine-protein kinase|nr:eukaryotic-like serine/threonine-protein kinase [Actinomycetota bacterium]
MNPNDVIQGRYRLEKPIGRGGMAEVWCARDSRLDRSVAVKVLSHQFHDDPEWLVRFFSEAQSVARISHPNVVSVLDFGEFEERPYLVMEYAPGGSLAEFVGEPVLPERALEVVAEAASGAGAAHDAGLVHRDIKPGNILLTDDKRAKLADFGIAAGEGSERLTATGLAIGSPHYVSPEQASGRTATPRSDVYSLGVVLYELLTGRPPFDADNAMAIAIAHVEKAPEPPSKYVPGLDPAIDELALRALAKDPAARFANGHEFAAALEAPERVAALVPMTGTEIVDHDEGYWAESPPIWKRMAIGVAVLVTLIGGAAAVVWASGRGEPARALSHDLEVRDQGALQRAKKRPAPTPSSGAVISGATTPSPTPTAAEEQTDSKEKDSEPTVTVVSEDPEEPDQEPSPEPTSQPTPEPTTQPTAEPTGEAPPP